MLFTSCSKEESNNSFVWSKSYGEGEAFYVKPLSDSVFIACGRSDGKPFLVSINKERKENFVINPDIPGSFTSFVTDETGMTLAGNNGTNLLLMRYNLRGEPVWQDTLHTGFNVESARLLTVNGGLLAIASPLPDSLGNGDTGFMFVRLDTTGLISLRKKISTAGYYVSAFDATQGFNGNILLAITKKQATTKSRAYVASYSPVLDKIWEAELFNNPSFSSACLFVVRDVSGKIYAGGRSEITSQGILTTNSFLTALEPTGITAPGWSQKKYTEFSNEGRSLLFDAEGKMLILDRRCFIVNKLDRIDGSDVGIIRPFNACASVSTDAFASGFSIVGGKEFVFAGSLGNRFFLGIKTLQ